MESHASYSDRSGMFERKPEEHAQCIASNANGSFRQLHVEVCRISKISSPSWNWSVGCSRPSQVHCLSAVVYHEQRALGVSVLRKMDAVRNATSRTPRLDRCARHLIHFMQRLTNRHYPYLMATRRSHGWRFTRDDTGMPCSPAIMHGCLHLRPVIPYNGRCSRWDI